MPWGCSSNHSNSPSSLASSSMMGIQAKFFRSFSRVELQTLSFVIFTGFFLISVTLLVLPAGHFVSFPSLGSWLSPRAFPLPRAGENDSNNQNVDDLHSKPLCDTSDRRADICDMEGDIRIQASSSSIFFVTSSIRNSTTEQLQGTWKIKPHPRKGDRPAMSGVTEMSVGYLSTKQVAPKCDINSTVPAIIFATGGYMGNFFHEVSDSIIPLYISSHKFDGEVQFLISEMLPWWMTKYELLLKKLTHYEIINFNKDAMVRCYPRVIVGITFHKDMGIDPARSGGVTMFDFGRFIRSTYSLERETATKMQGTNPENRPRLLIIARSRTRRFTNVDEIERVVGWQGFEPVVAEIKRNQSLAEFARQVNSCDAILGVHGAGLTNLIFLPTNAVVIQVVPLGGMDNFCYADYGVPSLEMKMKYLQYGIGVMESSLVDRYGITDPVVIDPKSVQAQKDGWRNWTLIYFFNQDVKLDVARFSSFLTHARELLRE